MSTLTAIPTEYNGFTFKSRLESHFAQWLDKHDVEWTAEINRTLGKNQYKPDFFVAGDDYGWFVEIKPFVYAQEAWIAITSAQEVREDLFCICDAGRDEWRTFAVVGRGELLYYTAFECFLKPVLCDTKNGLLISR